MSTLGRWLVGILNAHIERHNVPTAEPVTVELTLDTSHFDAELQRLRPPPVNVIPRPCWNCGIRAAFDAHYCGRPTSAWDHYVATLGKIAATADGIAQLGHAINAHQGRETPR